MNDHINKYLIEWLPYKHVPHLLYIFVRYIFVKIYLCKIYLVVYLANLLHYFIYPHGDLNLPYYIKVY